MYASTKKKNQHQKVEDRIIVMRIRKEEKNLYVVNGSCSKVNGISRGGGEGVAISVFPKIK